MIIRFLFLGILLTGTAQAGTPRTATFSSGCFRCVEDAFDAVEGVESTTSSYANGHLDNPTYRQASAGGTGYVESL